MDNECDCYVCERDCVSQARMAGDYVRGRYAVKVGNRWGAWDWSDPIGQCDALLVDECQRDVFINELWKAEELAEALGSRATVMLLADAIERAGPAVPEDKPIPTFRELSAHLREVRANSPHVTAEQAYAQQARSLGPRRK